MLTTADDTIAWVRKARPPGRRRTRLQGALWRRLRELERPAWPAGDVPNEREIAARLRDEDFPRNWSAPGAGDLWTEDAVRWVWRLARAETFHFFEQVSTVLRALECADKAEKRVSRASFVRLCEAERFSHYWLWDRFQDASLFADSYDELAPPVQVDVQDDVHVVAVSQAGNRLIAWWDKVGAGSIPAAALDVVGILAAAAVMRTRSVSGQELQRLCRRYHTNKTELLKARLIKLDGDQVVLEERGRTAGTQWALIKGEQSDEEPETLDVWYERYWPREWEEENLPPDWEWSDHPLRPRREAT